MRCIDADYKERMGTYYPFDSCPYNNDTNIQFDPIGRVLTHNYNIFKRYGS